MVYMWLEKVMVAFLVMKCEEVAASSNSRKSCEIEKKNEVKLLR